MRRYPRVRTVYAEEPELEVNPALRMHPIVVVTYAEGQECQRFCGDSWCSSRCGLPALIIPQDEERPEYKVFSNMVAVGNLAGCWQVEWKGAKVEVPPEHRGDFLTRLWW